MIGASKYRQFMQHPGFNKGGGGGTSTTTQEIPAELKPLATRYTQNAMALDNTPYQYYQGQRYADPNSAQMAGLQMTANRAMNGSQTMNNAESNLNQMMNSGPNPYLSQMVQQAQADTMSSAIGANRNTGAYGNTGLAEATARNMGNIATQMYGDAYAQDQGNRLQAMSMAPQFGNQAYQDANQLLNAGNFLQDQAQQNLDFGYQQWQEGQDHPYKKLAAQAGVFGSNLGGTSATTQTGGGK